METEVRMFCVAWCFLAASGLCALIDRGNTNPFRSDEGFYHWNAAVAGFSAIISAILLTAAIITFTIRCW